jgi:phosphopantothenoylcysteine decarboxylase / phosphopantothenate---cysteine ligase
VILQHIGRVLGEQDGWRGRRVVVTAGPTREAVDAVRVLTNRSSGHMGCAIAAAAWRRGAEVTLITGPLTVPLPPGPAVQHVETAADMLAAVRDALADADLLVMAAAVADFRPAEPGTGKPEKGSAGDSIRLEPTADILRTTREDRAAGAVVVGFALQTGDGREKARSKLEDKGLDLIVLNSADEPGAGFDVPTNRVTLLARGGGEEALPLMSKEDVADALLDRIAPLLKGRP